MTYLFHVINDIIRIWALINFAQMWRLNARIYGWPKSSSLGRIIREVLLGFPEACLSKDSFIYLIRSQIWFLHVELEQSETRCQPHENL